MKGLDLNSIKDREIKIESTEESLKDVRPLFSKEEINMLWENRRIRNLEREINTYKNLWCRYHCTAKNTKINVTIESHICYETCFEDDKYVTIENETAIREEACKLCQIDAFIRELISQKVI